MKIIFSRKGFDQSAGGFPSLIFPDGTLFSIPIPSGPDNCTYSSLAFKYGGDTIQHVLNQVTNEKMHYNKRTHGCNYVQPEQGCHHDPMYLTQSNRLTLGQTGGAESLLRNQGVAEGDIFLFYGWFKRIALTGGRWSYLHEARDVHLIWSYMIVGAALNLDTQEDIAAALAGFPDLKLHPHLARDWDMTPNRVYVSEEHALLRFSEDRCLTDLRNYEGRSKWRLPICFTQPKAFTHLKSFSPEGDDVIVRFRGFGQEFVLDLGRVSSDADRMAILQYVNRIRCP